MSTVFTVAIADMKIAKSEDILVTYALGSCVGICLYDSTQNIACLGHIMLPSKFSNNPQDNLMKYADTCIPLMISEMKKLGCHPLRLTAKIAGGAQMFQVVGDSDFGNIGKRNVTAVKEILLQNRIKIVAEDTGDTYGRTVYFHAEDGKMIIQSFIKGTRTL